MTIRCIILTIMMFVLTSLLISCHKSSHHTSPIEQFVSNSKAPIYHFKVIRTYPHDQHNFTEGLLLDNEFLYESSGLYQQSKLEKKDLFSGKILRETQLSPNYFAEGITLVGNSIYQLTYKEHTSFVYDKNTFKLEKTFYFPTEGWGLTSDDKQLIMSNGSATLFFIDPNTFRLMRTIVVHDQNQAVLHLNELEYIEGTIYANIWPTDMIAIISPATGAVLGWINITALHTFNCGEGDCVANGIAYHEKNHTLLVTGKNWPLMYEIQLTR